MKTAVIILLAALGLIVTLIVAALATVGLLVIAELLAEPLREID